MLSQWSLFSKFSRPALLAPRCTQDWRLVKTQQRVCILYGSQWGNSQMIAQRIHAQLQENGFSEVTIGTLDEFEKLGLLQTDSTLRVIVVCSTTGQGDPPKNAEAFYSRFVRKCKKHQPAPAADQFAHIYFHVLAIGDSNYGQTFCYVGKKIDIALHKLGGTRFFPLKKIDDASNEAQPETIDPHINEILKALRDNCARNQYLGRIEEIDDEPSAAVVTRCIYPESKCSLG